MTHLAQPTSGLMRHAVGGMLWLSFSTGAQAVVQTAALVILARLLEPRDFGVIGAALIVVGFSTIFSQLGVGPAIVQRPVLEPRHLRVGFTLSMGLGVLVAGLVWVLAPFVAGFFKMAQLEQVLRAVALVFLCQGSATVSEALAQRGLRFRWLAAVELGAFAVGFLLVGSALAFLGLGVWALVSAHLTQNVLRAAVLVLGQPHPRRPLLERRTASELLYFGGGFTLARIGNYLAGQGDNLVVGRWLGTEALGFYAQAYQLMVTPANLLGQVLDRVLFPTMALVQAEPTRLRRAYRAGITTVASLVLPASLVLALLAPELVLTLLGPKWAPAVVPFQLLALGLLFRTSCKLSDSVVRATGAVYARAGRQGIYALAVLGGAWLGQHTGLAGVALGVLIAITLNFVLMADLSLRLIGMRWREFLAAHLPALALTLAVVPPAWLVAHALRASHAPALIVVLAAMLFLAAAILLLGYLLPHLFFGPDSRRLLNELCLVMRPRMTWRRPSALGAADA
jgi:O-antigen/teichoic acid export membrane protein